METSLIGFHVNTDGDAIWPYASTGILGRRISLMAGSYLRSSVVLCRPAMGHHVFIDPLPPDFTSEELKVLLAQFGNVKSASVPYDSIGKSLRFGYVEMETEESADNACKRLNRTLFRDAKLTVLRARELDAAA
jgi:hypothetical protein